MKKRDIHQLLLVLVVGLAHGLVYLFLMPPWQHYDEPNHFEYARLIADRSQLPQPGDYDQDMRREIARSMIEHDFFKGMGFLPDLEVVDRPIWIGDYSQISDPPLYYLLGAIAISLVPDQDVAAQLYSFRMVSLLFYLLSIFAAWGIMREITAEDNFLRLLVPLTVALLPGYTDFMTAVNNLVAGVSIFSLCLWGCIRLVERGISLWNFLWVTVTTILCLLITASVYFALPLFLLSLLFGLFRHGKRWIAWGILAGCVLIGAALMFSWGDAALWHRSTLQALPLRAASPEAILGAHVFQVDAGGELPQSWSVPAYQSVGYGLSPGSYTFGAWIWSSLPTQVQSPVIGVGSQLYSVRLDIDQQPKFYTLSFSVPEGTPSRVWVSLVPDDKEGNKAMIYYDGLVIAAGDRPSDEPPIFAGADGRSGFWGGGEFHNPLRNGSAEQASLRFKPWADAIGSRILPERILPSLFLTYLTDWQGVGWLHRAVSVNLFHTFWGKFGWSHVWLMGQPTYKILGMVSGLALVGIVIWLVNRIVRRKSRSIGNLLPWEVVFLMGMVILYFWGGAYLRGAPYLQVVRLYIPVVRYAYPAIIPTVLLLALGWITILGLIISPIRSRFPQPEMLTIGIYTLLWLIFDVIAILSIYWYYA